MKSKHWRLNRKSLILEFINNKNTDVPETHTQIDLKRCNNYDAIFREIMWHIERPMYPDEAIRELIFMLDSILGIRSYYGSGKPQDVKKLIEGYIEN